MFVRQHPQHCGKCQLTRAAQCRGSRPQRRCGSTCWVASRCGSRNGVEWVSSCCWEGRPPAQPAPDPDCQTGTRSKRFKCGRHKQPLCGSLGLRAVAGGAAGGADWRQAVAAPRLRPAAATAHRLSSRKSYAVAAGSAIAAARQQSSAASPRRLESAMAMAIGEARGPARSNNASFSLARRLGRCQTVLGRGTACTPWAAQRCLIMAVELPLGRVGE